MIFDNSSNEKCFHKIVETNEEIPTLAIETNSISPSSLPELNVISSPISQRHSIESPNAPSGTINSPLEEESTKKILKCDYCDKTFTLANVLKVHQRIHTGEKPYVCEICGKAFNQSGSLNRHRNTHRYRDATDNNFICRFCNAKFPHGSLLETHEKSAHHNRRSGRPRNLSSVDNSATSLDGKGGESYSKFNFSSHNEIKRDKLSPLVNEGGDLKTDATGILKDHISKTGNGEYAFTCPYCQLGVNDIRELGIHISHHNISNGLVSGSTSMNSPPIPMLSKNNSLFPSESLVHQLTSLSKKLKLPPTSDFNHNLGSIPTSSFMPMSFDRLRPTENIPNMNFHMSNNNNNNNSNNQPNLPSNPPVLSESYNLAAFVLATLSKDYLYKHRNQISVPHQENGFPMPSPEFLKNHLFNQKSSLLGPIVNTNNLDFYNLFNLQKPLHNLMCNVDTNNSMKINSKIENDQNVEMHDNNFNVMPMSNPSPSSFLPRTNGKELLILNGNGKSSMTRSSPASSGHTTHSSSNKTTDIFFSRKNGGERRKCPDCDKQFTCESALRIHYRKHSGERPYACEFCSKTFSQNGTLKRHHLTCKNRPSILSNNKIKSINNKSSMSQDPDSTREVNNSSTGSNYGMSNSPTYPSSHPLSFMINTKVLNTNINDTLTKFDHFSNKPLFQPLSSYSSCNVSRKTSGLRSPYNNIGSSEEPTDLTINGSRNEETVSQSIDEETHLDIDSIDENKISLKIEENNNSEDMETTDSKINITSISFDSNPNKFIFNNEKNIIYNFSTKEILTHLVENGRLKMCRHCLIYFENEQTYNKHIKSHSEEESSLECNDCKFVAKDEVAFKDHFNNLSFLSQNQ